MRGSSCLVLAKSSSREGLTECLTGSLPKATALAAAALVAAAEAEVADDVADVDAALAEVDAAVAEVAAALRLAKELVSELAAFVALVEALNA